MHPIQKRTTEKQEYRLRAFLSSLGSTEKEVAQRLKRWGIKGKPKEPGICPLARLICKKFRFSSVRVRYYTIIVHHPEYYSLQITRVPAALKDFARSFDKGLYPELIEEDNEPTTGS